MNHRGINPTMAQEGYLNWQDPESGEWMTLTVKGNPFENGERIQPKPEQGTAGMGLPRKTCDRSATRYRNWTGPFRASGAVA